MLPFQGGIRNVCVTVEDSASELIPLHGRITRFCHARASVPSRKPLDHHV